MADRASDRLSAASPHRGDSPAGTGQADGASGLSRRDFLQQGTSVAGAAALATVPRPAAAAGPAGSAPAPVAAPAQILGPGAIPVTLFINGKEQRVQVEPRDTLVDVLRSKLGLTGTKIGCDRGACGACTVWVDGAPTPACMTLALDVASLGGAPPKGGTPAVKPPAITTIEGLAKGNTLHPLQQCFIDNDALQCGFCTPGMVMSCAALVEQKRAAGTLASVDEHAVREAIAGNLCRCGSYPGVIAATLAFVKGPASPGPGGGK